MPLGVLGDAEISRSKGPKARRPQYHTQRQALKPAVAAAGIASAVSAGTQRPAYAYAAAAANTAAAATTTTKRGS